MDLNLSNRGLFSFDAAQARRSLAPSTQPPLTRSPGASSTTSDAAQAPPSAPQRTLLPSSAATKALPVIRQLNLSYNSLHLFTGGETLRGLAVLDLSHNALTQLRCTSLPTTLVQLNLAHNRLAQLTQLSDCTPRLQVLDVSHNQLSPSALRGLPTSLTQLNAEANLLDSLTPFTHLLHLVRLNVALNQLENSDVLTSLHPLLSLRMLDVRGNPLCREEEAEKGGSCGVDSSSAATSSSSNVGTTAEAGTRVRHLRLAALLGRIVPRLSHLNGVPLSQAPQDRLLKHGQSSGGQRNNSRAGDRSSSLNGSRVRAGGAPEMPSYASSSRASLTTPVRPALEVRLMQAKVSELRRLLLAAQDAEGKARQERSLLLENVKSTAVVIDQQGAEMEKLQEEIAGLRDMAQKLQAPVAAAEESFEQVHASLLATKAKESAARLKL